LAKIVETNQVKADQQTRLIADLVRAFQKKQVALGARLAPLAIASRDMVELVGAVASLAQTELDGLIVPSERLTIEVRDNLLAKGYHLLHLTEGTVTPPEQVVPPRRGRICLQTSGTTGVPKIIEHTWQTLFTMSKLREFKPQNWLVTYQAGTYAWYQMLTLALFVPGQSLTLPRERDPVRAIEAALQHEVTAISGTPTFWRMAFLQFSATTLQALPLRQITLGGERVDQVILDRLQSLYPAATVTHIYASTEAGACIIVRDGREGFPIAWLAANGQASASDERPVLQVRDGTLWIRSPHAAVDQAEWINSGDAAEIRGDRVFILGREDKSIINVGGIKVAACDVERRILEHPSVLWCRVYGRKAPLLGQLVASDVVFRPAAVTATEAELAHFCNQHLPEYMVPRVWNFLDTIPTTDNLKTPVT